MLSCDCAINNNKVNCSKCLHILKVAGKWGSAANKAAEEEEEADCKNVRGIIKHYTWTIDQCRAQPGRGQSRKNVC